MGRISTLAPDLRAPGDLDHLFPREREIALLVYSRGCVTAKEVESAIGGLTNAAVRSMLNRLVKKGLVTRQELKAPNPFVYGPALTNVDAQEQAIRQCTEDFFGGSLDEVAAALADLYASRGVAPHVPAAPAKRRQDGFKATDLPADTAFPIAAAA